LARGTGVASRLSDATVLLPESLAVLLLVVFAHGAVVGDSHAVDALPDLLGTLVWVLTSELPKQRVLSVSLRRGFKSLFGIAPEAMRC